MRTVFKAALVGALIGWLAPTDCSALDDLDRIKQKPVLGQMTSQYLIPVQQPAESTARQIGFDQATRQVLQSAPELRRARIGDSALPSPCYTLATDLGVDIGVQNCKFRDIWAARLHGTSDSADSCTACGSATNSDAVDVADVAGDTTTFCALWTAATGTLPGGTDAGCTYNATTNALTIAGAFAASNVSGTNTGDETAAGILAKIITVDGAGSALDADTIDTLDSTAFSLTGHNHTGVYEPADAFLTSIGMLGTAADRMIYTTGVDTAAETALTAFARTILDDADAATVRATIGAGTGGGSVTSVDGSGGTTGLTLTGGPITTTGTLTLGGTLAVANGGTGSATASDARTALGLAIGTNVQAWDADLTSWAAVARAAGFDTFAATALGATTTILVGGGVGVVPVWTTATGTGAPMRADSATFTTGLTGTITSTTKPERAVVLKNLDTANTDAGALIRWDGQDSTPTNRVGAYFGALLTARTAGTTTHRFSWWLANASATPTEILSLTPTALHPWTAGGVDLGLIAKGYNSLFLDESGAGTQTAQIIAPALAADIVLTTPAATGTLATLAGIEDLSQKRIGGRTATGDLYLYAAGVATTAYLRIYDNGAGTEGFQFFTSGGVDILTADVTAATVSIGNGYNLGIAGGGGSGYIDIGEYNTTTDAAAPSADRARVYVRDNGAGKEQLVVRFATGAVQVIATEP